MFRSWRDSISHTLDAVVRPDMRVAGTERSSFQVCGIIGLAAAVLLSMTLAVVQRLSPWIIAVIILSAVASFLALAMVTKIIVGEERLIYYHHEVAVVAVAAAILWLLDRPLLAYLDVTLLGVGAFLACGRVGCLMVGCCHGRPHRWGVRYRSEHAAAGFSRYLVGVRLFPIQAVESLWVAAIVTVGAVLAVRGEPGAAFAWYVVSYDLGRFCSEFLRGDADRPYLWGFSEAQWFSVVLMCFVVASEAAGLLPFQPWHGWATAAVILVMVMVGFGRSREPTASHRLRRARHVHELAQLLDQVEAAGPAAEIAVGRTSLGIALSSGEAAASGERVRHYSLSESSAPLSAAAACSVAELILQLRHPARPNVLTAGGRGVFHLLVRPRRPQDHGSGTDQRAERGSCAVRKKTEAEAEAPSPVTAARSSPAMAGTNIPLLGGFPTDVGERVGRTGEPLVASPYAPARPVPESPDVDAVLSDQLEERPTVLLRRPGGA